MIQVWMKPDIMEMFRNHLHVEQMDWKMKRSMAIILK